MNENIEPTQFKDHSKSINEIEEFTSLIDLNFPIPDLDIPIDNSASETFLHQLDVVLRKSISEFIKT